MMSQNHTHKSEKPLQEAIEPILRVIIQLGGHFTFTDQQGEQFVIARKSDFENQKKEAKPEGQQMSFALSERNEPLKKNAEDEGELDQINQDLALARDVVDEFSDVFESEQPGGVLIVEAQQDETTPPPPVRVRFEPIRGDLPPELQE